MVWGNLQDLYKFTLTGRHPKDYRSRPWNGSKGVGQARYKSNSHMNLKRGRWSCMGSAMVLYTAKAPALRSIDEKWMSVWPIVSRYDHMIVTSATEWTVGIWQNCVDEIHSRSTLLIHTYTKGGWCSAMSRNRIPVFGWFENSFGLKGLHMQVIY